MATQALTVPIWSICKLSQRASRKSIGHFLITGVQNP
jgi:hypothetical protein